MKTQYTPEYFINKFEAIPEDEWTTERFTDNTGKRHCVLGHCGSRAPHTGSKFKPSEAEHLNNLFEDNLGTAATEVNDYYIYPYTQPTPKQRILAALRDIAKMEKK